MQFPSPTVPAPVVGFDPLIAEASATPKNGSISAEKEAFFDIWCSAFASDAGSVTQHPDDMVQVLASPVSLLLPVPQMPEVALAPQMPSPSPDVSDIRTDTKAQDDAYPAVPTPRVTGAAVASSSDPEDEDSVTFVFSPPLGLEPIRTYANAPDDAFPAVPAPRVTGAAVASPSDPEDEDSATLVFSPPPGLSTIRAFTNAPDDALPAAAAPRVTGAAGTMPRDTADHGTAHPASVPEPATAGGQIRSDGSPQPDFPAFKNDWSPPALQELVTTDPRPAPLAAAYSPAGIGPDRLSSLQASPLAKLEPLPIPHDDPASATVQRPATAPAVFTMPDLHRKDPASTIDLPQTVPMVAPKGVEGGYPQAVQEQADLTPHIRQITDIPQSELSTQTAPPPRAIPSPAAPPPQPSGQMESLPPVLSAALPERPVPPIPFKQPTTATPDASTSPYKWPAVTALAEPTLSPHLRLTTPPAPAPPLPVPVETTPLERSSAPTGQIGLQQQITVERDFWQFVVAVPVVQQGLKPISTPAIPSPQPLPDTAQTQGLEPILTGKNVSNIALTTASQGAIPLETVPSQPSPAHIAASLPVPTPAHLTTKPDQSLPAAVMTLETTLPAMATLPPDGSGFHHMPPDTGPEPGRAPVQIVHSAVLAEGQRLLSAPPDGPVTLTLSPQELGTLHFVVQETENGLHLHLTVDQPATLDLLRKQGDLLISDLRQAGFHNASLSFAGQEGQSNGHRHEDAPNPAPVASPYRDGDLPDTSNPLPPSAPAGGTLNLRL